MANYLKGIGDAALRVNEILPTFDARINNFLCGHTSGIIKGEFNEFYASAIDRGVIINSGMLQAHGFFGASDTDTQINFVMPSGTRYVHLYAEIDLSVVPNRFEIKATAQSNDAAYTFRQDNLRTITNGKFQLQLWQVTLTASSIILTDKRAYINKPLNAVNAEYAVKASDSDRATNATYASYASTNTGMGTIEQRLTNLGFRSGSVSLYGGGSTRLTRQGNYVVFAGYINYSAYNEGDLLWTGGVIGTLPVNFRPSSSFYTKIGGEATAINGQNSIDGNLPCTATITFNTDGTINLSTTYVACGGVSAIVNLPFSTKRARLCRTDFTVGFQAPAI